MNNKSDKTKEAIIRAMEDEIKELLAKISDMMPNSEKRSESLTVFQGFTPEQLTALSSDGAKMIGKMEEPIEEVGD